MRRIKLFQVFLSILLMSVCYQTFGENLNRKESEVIKRSEEESRVYNQRGIAYHNKRFLDDASTEYAKVLDLSPPQEPTRDQLDVVYKFVPRLYVNPDEIFSLKDFIAILHPDKRIIAYHLFCETWIRGPERG